jgi:hypothetical protein
VGEFDATLHAGDFLYVSAWLPHQEINPSSELPFEWIVVRSTSEPIVVESATPFGMNLTSFRAIPDAARKLAGHLLLWTNLESCRKT